MADENATLEMRLAKKVEKKGEFDYLDFEVTLLTGSNFSF